MDPINEIEFIYQLSLRNMKKHPKGFNFSCDMCRDRKRRGYILIDNGTKGHSTVYCHNCGLSTTVGKFIEMTSPGVYEEYRAAERKEYIENLKQGKFTEKKKDVSKILAASLDDVVHNLKLFQFNTKYFHPATSSPECVAYAKKRKIPEHIFETLYYNSHAKAEWGNMLIFPFRQGEYVYGFQGRTVDGSKRFHTFSKNESFKIYNIFNVDLEKPVYIFEAIIDSFHKTNSVAMCGADLSTQVQQMIKYPVYVFDFDKTGVTKAIKYAEAGHKVFVWPQELRSWKDFNAAVCAGVAEKTLERAVLDNTFTGLAAVSRLRFILKSRKW